MNAAIPLIVYATAAGDRSLVAADDLRDDPEDQPVVRRVKQAMRESGVRQADLARALNTHPTTVWRYLTSKKNPIGLSKKLVAIARVLKVDAQWLESGGEGEPPPDEHTATIEKFIADFGESMKITLDERVYLRAHPNHRVTPGDLLDALLVSRRGLSAEDTARGIQKTSEVRAKGDALGVPKRKAR